MEDRCRPAGPDVATGNPVWSVGFQVEEAIRANGIAKGRKEVRERAVQVLEQAGLQNAEQRMKQYPHQFSGGMKQRALIGIGLSAEPELLIADEPTSALDVTVQRVVLDHLETLTSQLGTAVVFITHDLGARRGTRGEADRDVPGQHCGVGPEPRDPAEPAASVHQASRVCGPEPRLAADRR